LKIVKIEALASQEVREKWKNKEPKLVIPLLIVDGKMIETEESKIFNALFKEDKIESYIILKMENEIEQYVKLYGEKAKNGVVIVTTK